MLALTRAGAALPTGAEVGAAPLTLGARAAAGVAAGAPLWPPQAVAAVPAPAMSAVFSQRRRDHNRLIPCGKLHLPRAAAPRPGGGHPCLHARRAGAGWLAGVALQSRPASGTTSVMRSLGQAGA